MSSHTPIMHHHGSVSHDAAAPSRRRGARTTSLRLGALCLATLCSLAVLARFAPQPSTFRPYLRAAAVAPAPAQMPAPPAPAGGPGVGIGEVRAMLQRRTAAVRAGVRPDVFVACTGGRYCLSYLPKWRRCNLCRSCMNTCKYDGAFACYRHWRRTCF